MAWKKILLEGDAATLSDTASQPIGTSASAGTGGSAARWDHVHELGAGCIDDSSFFAAGVVDSNAIATGAVGSDEIATGAVGSDEIATNAVGNDELNNSEGFEMKQITLTPASTATAAEGAIFYDSDDDHLYVYVS